MNGCESKRTTSFLDGYPSSESETPPNIISSYTRSTKDNSEWSTHETMYMDVRMPSTSSQSQKSTLIVVPIDQIAIVIADLILSEVLVTEEDKDNLYIFHDFKSRTTMFSKEKDGLSGHLFLITSGRTKAAATPRTTRINADSIVIQTVVELCDQVPGLVHTLFSRDTGIDPMEVARAEDERRLARDEPNDVRKEKLEDLEIEQLDKLTQLLNLTLKNISWTRMDKQLRDEIDRVVYPWETTEERTERRRVEKMKKAELVEQLKAKKLLEQKKPQEKKRLEKEERERAAAEKKRLEHKGRLEQIEQAKKRLAQNPFFNYASNIFQKKQSQKGTT